MCAAVGGFSALPLDRSRRLKQQGWLLMLSVFIVWEAKSLNLLRPPPVGYLFLITLFCFVSLLPSCSIFVSINPSVTYHRHLRPVSSHSAEWKPRRGRAARESASAQWSATNATPNKKAKTAAREPARPGGP